MLEKPDLQVENIVACLQKEYGLFVAQVVFLSLGADQNTAVYHVIADDETPYFLKLRKGDFNATSVTVPKFLSDQGIAQIIAPLTTKTGQLWASLESFKVILYPFIEGHNGYKVELSDHHWSEFGTALKSIHTAEMPPTLTSPIQQETYSSQWRDIVKTFVERVEDGPFDDPVAVKLAAFLKVKRNEILDLVGRAERLAEALQAHPPEFIVCHADIHAGNILIDTNGAFYIVDWDTLTLAPKERDLMSIGAGLMGNWRTPEEEETLFYQGYDQTQIDPLVLAYYRYERIIQDIAVFCEQLLLTNEGGEDREQFFHYLKSNFLPNSTIEIAYKSDKTLSKKSVKL